MKKAIVCYSGGHSSALVAIEAVRKYGKQNVILLNHDISSHVEHEDIKRFKRDVADYLDVDITYANHPDFEKMTPIEVCRKEGTITAGQPGNALCTNRLKTKPFYNWLKKHHPADFDHPSEDAVILYGFDANEKHRIQRRSSILGAKGYHTDYPLAFWDRSIENTEEIGIARPVTYKIYKHANCIGCLKARRQHWYCVYCLRPDIWQEAIDLERELGHSIMQETFMEELLPLFREMKEEKGICPSQKISSQAFWAMVNQRLPGEISIFPCECAI